MEQNWSLATLSWSTKRAPKDRARSTAKMSVVVFRNGSYHLERTVIPIRPPCFPFKPRNHHVLIHPRVECISYMIVFLVNADHICMRQYYVVTYYVGLSWRISESTVPIWPRAVTRRVPSIHITGFCEHIWLIKRYPILDSVTEHPEAYVCNVTVVLPLCRRALIRAL